MDIFRREAEKELAEQSFQNRPLQYDLFQISSVDLKSHISGGHLPAAKLERRETDWIGTASLTLVKVVFEPGVPQILHTTADDLLELFRCLDLDPYMLYLMYRDVMGYHQVGVRQSIHSPNESVYNFFINVDPLKVLWSFNPANVTTKGIVLPRDTDGGKASCDGFCLLVEKYAPLMAHPVFPAFAAVLEVMAFSEKMINKVHQEVSDTEMETGFSPWSLDVLYDFTKPKELDKFIERSQTMAASLVNLEVVMRQTKMMQRIKNSLQESRDEFLTGATSERTKIAMQTAQKEIFQLVSLTQPRLEYAELYANNLRERAKNQLTVVFNVIGRGDAHVNIDLARSVKADGTSMKVIAIMTMAFLPGTFFATLFSVPSLKWDRSPVVQSNFWVYLAFTMPCTAAVFGLWFGFTQMHSRTWEWSPREANEA